MYSIGILSAVLFGLLATTTAHECRPVLCKIACPFGFDIDDQGCPYCSCRATPNVCLEPLFGYNCGIRDHGDCPSSHECQFDFNGFTGQCCLKSSSSTTASSESTTARIATDTSSARVNIGATDSSTSSALKRLLATSTQSTIKAQGSSSAATATQRSVTPGRSVGPNTSTQR